MQLPKLNLPSYQFRFKKSAQDEILIFDFIRKKWLVLTPEEWVRQNFNKFLIEELEYPESMFKVETGLNINQRQKRSDTLIYNNNKPVVLVEYKAPKIKLDETVLNQALTYNSKYNCKYIYISNGMQHYAFRIDGNEIQQLKSLYPFASL